MSVMGGNILESAELGKASVGDAPIQGTTKEMQAGRGSIDVRRAEKESVSSMTKREIYEDTPTEEEMQTLRRISGKIPWTAWTIAFVELCERFSWYGTTGKFSK